MVKQQKGKKTNLKNLLKKKLTKTNNFLPLVEGGIQEVAVIISVKLNGALVEATSICEAQDSSRRS